MIKERQMKYFDEFNGCQEGGNMRHIDGMIEENKKLMRWINKIEMEEALKIKKQKKGKGCDNISYQGFKMFRTNNIELVYYFF